MQRAAGAAGLLIVVLAAIRLTGRTPPGYARLAPDARLKAGGRTQTAREAAEAFSPRLSLGGFEAPTVCYFEVLPAQGDKVQVIYRFSWPDERHPIAALHHLYKLWRRLYFASPEDVEFVWVEADLATGKLVRLAYESPEGLYIVRHRYREHDKGFEVSGAHPLLRVASWNHIFEPAAPAEAAFPAALEHLDDGLYRELRMGRRSQPRLLAPLVKT